MTTSSEPPVEVELIQAETCVELHVVEMAIADTTVEDRHVRIDLRIGTEGEDDEDDVEIAAFGIIYVLGLLSFADARPRGILVMDFVEGDEWTSSDMLRRLRFEQGELRFYADYVRGRMMKTLVVVRSDSTVRLETTNRGETATRWVAKLQGKKILSVVQAENGANRGWRMWQWWFNPRADWQREDPPQRA